MDSVKNQAQTTKQK